MQRGELETAIRESRFARVQIPRETPTVRIAVRCWNDDLGEIRPDRLMPGPAERSLCLAIPFRDRPPHVDADERFVGRFDDRATSFFAQAKGLLRLLGEAPRFIRGDLLSAQL